MMKKWVWHSVVIAVLGMAPLRPAFADISIYFFNPDARNKEVLKIKSDFESLAREASGETVEFQPFLNYDQLKSRIQEKAPDFLIISSLYFADSSKTFSIEKISGTSFRKNKKMKKVLLAKDASMQSLKKSKKSIQVGVANFGENPEKTLKECFYGKTKSKADFSVLKLKKEFDVVMALLLGSIQVAVTTRATLDFVSTVNPLVKQLKVIGETRSYGMPLVGRVGEVSGKKIRMMKKIMKKFNDDNSEGIKKLKELLHITRFE